MAAMDIKEDFLYIRLADTLENQIQHQVLKVGDKLPSVRVLSREQGVSMSTTLQAYYHLEAKGLIEARPKSGYFVRFSAQNFPELPAKSQPKAVASTASPEEMIDDVYQDLTQKNLVRFSLSAPSSELLPLGKLVKVVNDAMRALPSNGTMYDSIQGNYNLRNQIARRALLWEGKLKPGEIITSAGCMSAISFALMAIVEKGDTIIVESPVYFGILQLASTLGLKVLELPTDPRAGIDPDALKKAVLSQKISACILVSNFNNPLGSCMPDTHKKVVVEILEQNGVPLIENDMYGDVYFAKSRPRACKTFDKSGNVMWCGSVSKTLAPGFRVGWIAPGNFFEKVNRLKLYHSVSSSTLTHDAIARFLETGRYEHHLRKMRQVLHINCMHYIQAISTYFPEDTRVSQPTGGFILWVELNKKIDTFELYKEAMKYGISIAPGRMFSLQHQYTNCMRLSYGLSWGPLVLEALKRLGALCFEKLK